MISAVRIVLWSIAVSLAYALLALLALGVARVLVVGFVALLLVPEVVLTWKRRG